MFSKAKDKNAAEAQVSISAPEKAPAQSNNLMNQPKRSAPAKQSMGVPSIISSDVVMHGNINASGEVQFDGSLEGDIKAATLIIGEKASVKGEIMCDRVTIRGKVEGGIRAKQVALAATAHILGDIVHSSLAVENGAHFEGACRHSDDPLSEASSRDFRKQRPVSAPPQSAPVTTQNNGAMPEQDAAPAQPNDTPSFLAPNRSPLR
ncbi:MAG: polymer-forming cytoskeletal protein [Pseudomonadota bacterium]